MRLPLITCALLALIPAAAQAQSSVTMFGIADAGLVRESGGTAGTLTKISSGIGSVSRLGFRGNEDLGGGWSANLLLEMGLKLDTGEIDSAGSIFNRQAYVGLKHASYGALTLGRQYTPYYNTLGGVADPFTTGYAGSIKNLFPTGGNNTRASNTVLYVSPSLKGVTGELAYTLGEQAGSSSAGRQFGGALAYSQGALNVRFAFNRRNNDTATVAAKHGRNAVLAANYNFGAAKLYLAYGQDKGPNSAPLPNTSNPFGGVRPIASLDGAEYLVGLAIPAAGGTILASYISKDDDTAFNQDATQAALGYSYPLSKRTSLYTAYAKISNKRGAGYTVGNNGESGSGNSAFNLGVRHTF